MRLNSDDRGVTLTEVMVAVAILTIIIVPLSNALIVFLRNSDKTSQRLSENHDVQLAAAYFAQDVQSTGIRGPAPSFSPTTSIALTWAISAACDGRRVVAGTQVPTKPVVRFLWDDPTSSTALVRVQVSYVVAEDPSGERQLRRITCRGSPFTFSSEVIVVHNLDQSAAAPFTVTCSCTNPALLRSVTLTLHIRHPGNDGSAVVVKLTGERRQT